MKDGRTIGVVMATHWEARCLLRRFHFRRQERDLYRAVIQGRPVLLAVSGIGREAGWTAAMRLCDRGAAELVSMGFCGALVPGLRVGDRVRDRIVSVSAPVRNRAEREALARRANATACDMETQAIIEAGTRRGVPIRVRRVISDTLEEDLTPLFGSDPFFSPLRIAARLLNPKVWPLAKRLERNSRLAKQRLAEALGSYVAEENLHAAAR